VAFSHSIGKICDHRPKGCHYYPLVYDIEINECVLDKDCPHPKLFLKNRNKISIACKALKEYLEKDLRITPNNTFVPFKKISK
jgi:hypothetical protein